MHYPLQTNILAHYFRVGKIVHGAETLQDRQEHEETQIKVDFHLIRFAK